MSSPKNPWNDFKIEVGIAFKRPVGELIRGENSTQHQSGRNAPMFPRIKKVQRFYTKGSAESNNVTIHPHPYTDERLTIRYIDPYHHTLLFWNRCLCYHFHVRCLSPSPYVATLLCSCPNWAAVLDSHVQQLFIRTLPHLCCTWKVADIGLT